MTENKRSTLADSEDILNILYYGDPGSGKTSNLAAMARLGKVLFVNAESGLKRRPLIDLGVPVANIEIFPGPDDEISYESLEKLFWELKGRAEEGGLIGCCWDSTSEVHQILLSQTRNKEWLKATRLGKNRDQFFTDRSDYGTNTSEVTDLIRKFRDLPMHTGFSALQRRDIDEEDGKVIYNPALTPALGGNLQGYVDITCHTYEELVEGDDETEKWGAFRNAGKFKGKDRFRVLPPKLINPTFDRVLAYINGELTRETDDDMNEAKAKRVNKEVAQIERPETPALESPQAPAVETTEVTPVPSTPRPRPQLKKRS